MREIANWTSGLLASMIVGGMFGAWLLNRWLGGSVWGARRCLYLRVFSALADQQPKFSQRPQRPGEGRQDRLARG
jgi:hypothetical protein